MPFFKSQKDKYFQQVEGVYEDKLQGSLKDKGLGGRLYDADEIRRRNSIRSDAFKAAQNHASVVAGTVDRVSQSMGKEYGEQVESDFMKVRGNRDATEALAKSAAMRSRIVEHQVGEYRKIRKGDLTDEEVAEYRGRASENVQGMDSGEVSRRFADIKNVAVNEDNVTDKERAAAQREALVEVRVADRTRGLKDEGKLAELEELPEEGRKAIEKEVRELDEKGVGKAIENQRKRDWYEYQVKSRTERLRKEGELGEDEELANKDKQAIHKKIADMSAEQINKSVGALDKARPEASKVSEDDVTRIVQRNRVDEKLNEEVRKTVDYGNKVRTRDENRDEKFRRLTEDERKSFHVGAEQYDEETGFGNGVQDAQETYSEDESDVSIRRRARETAIRAKVFEKTGTEIKEELPQEGQLPSQKERDANARKIKEEREKLKGMSGEELEKYAREELDLSREELDDLAGEEVEKIEDAGRDLLQKRRDESKAARRDIDAPTEDEMGFSIFEKLFETRNTERSPLRPSKDGTAGGGGGLLDETPRTGQGAEAREKRLEEARRFKGQRGADEGLRSLDGISSSRNIDQSFKGQGNAKSLTSARNEDIVFGTNDEGEEEVQSAELQAPAAERQSGVVASLLSRVEALEQKTRNMAEF